jgi:hypothetical protein
VLSGGEPERDGLHVGEDAERRVDRVEETPDDLRPRDALLGREPIKQLTLALVDQTACDGTADVPRNRTGAG